MILGMFLKYCYALTRKRRRRRKKKRMKWHLIRWKLECYQALLYPPPPATAPSPPYINVTIWSVWIIWIRPPRPRDVWCTVTGLAYIKLSLQIKIHVMQMSDLQYVKTY